MMHHASSTLSMAGAIVVDDGDGEDDGSSSSASADMLGGAGPAGALGEKYDKKARYERRLTAFYRKHNPAKVVDVPQIVQYYIVEGGGPVGGSGAAQLNALLASTYAGANLDDAEWSMLEEREAPMTRKASTASMESMESAVTSSGYKLD